MIRLSIFLAVALSGCGVQSVTCATPDAQGVVDALKPRDQFRAMLSSTAEQTQTVRMAMQHNRSETEVKLTAAVEKAIQRHGPEWELNMVRGWAALSPADLRQVCDALHSRDQSTFMRFANRIGPMVQSSNQPLLNKAGAEVLDAVWSAPGE